MAGLALAGSSGPIMTLRGNGTRSGKGIGTTLLPGLIVEVVPPVDPAGAASDPCLVVKASHVVVPVMMEARQVVETLTTKTRTRILLTPDMSMQ